MGITLDLSKCCERTRVGSQAIAFASLHISPQTKNQRTLEEAAISTCDQNS
jgi:hypothetical protein